MMGREFTLPNGAIVAWWDAGRLVGKLKMSPMGVPPEDIPAFIVWLQEGPPKPKWRITGAGYGMMEVERTQRGFEIITFLDRYRTQCSLQQSSLAEFEQPGTSAVWFGVDENNARMHLNLELLKALLPHLCQWVETGSFVAPSADYQEGD